MNLSQIRTEGIKKPVIINYFSSINQEDFTQTASLFTEDGKLLAPFEKPIIGRSAIASYLDKEAKGMKLFPAHEIHESTEDHTKEIKVIGKVKTALFTVQVKELSFEEQMEVQRGIIEEKDTLISREYGSLSENTKLYFWYTLAQGMEAGTIIAVPDDYEPTGGVTELLSQIELMEFEQQITFLREAVVNAGAEPKSGAQV